MPAHTKIAATESPSHSIVVAGLEAIQACPNDASSSLGTAVFGVVFHFNLRTS